jgi:WD40 repeat protein
MAKISISYRRSDSEAMTGRIFDRLIAHYGKDAIFRDIDDIPPGTDFRHHINETLLKTNILLAVVGPQWLGIAGSGLDRIHEESDPVRVEVETALRRRVPIIPILIGNTRMPGSDQLPPSLKDFAFRNAVKVDTGQDFDYHMDRLIRAMDAILGQTSKSPPSGETKIPPSSSSPPSRETKIPSGPPKLSTAERQAAALLDVPHKKDTGARAAVSGTFNRPMDGKQDGGTPAKWLETLWPENRQGRILRVAIAGAIAILLVGVPIGLWLTASGGAGGQRLLTLAGHTAAVSSVAFSPNARTIVTGSVDRSVRIWDAGSGQLLRTLTGDTEAVSSVAFLPDGKRIASGSLDRTILLWNADNGQLIRTLRSDQTYSWEVPPAVWSIAVSPDGTRIVSGSADATVKIWNDSSGELLRILKGHGDVVTSVAFFSNGKAIVSGSKDGTVRIWDADSGTLVRSLTGHAGQILSVAVSPDGKRIAAGGSGNSIVIWNAATGQQQRVLSSESTTVDSVAFSPDSKRIAAGGSDMNIDIWDVDDGQHLRTLTGHSGSIRALAYSSDGGRLASASDDKTIDVWTAN